MTFSQSWQENLVKFYKNRGKLQNLAALVATQDLQVQAKQNQKDRAAESDYVRKNLYGCDEPNAASEDMGTTILGDIQIPAPQIIPPTPQSSFAPLVAAAATAIAGALGGYMYANKSVPPQAPVVEQPVEYRVTLGNQEDYLGK